MKNFYYLIICFFLAGCTTMNVVSIDKNYSISHVCIEKNPKVIVSDFLEIVRDEFSEHKISTEVYESNKIPKNCTYHMTYTAFQTWDVVMYMHHAELRLFKGNQKIGDAEFHLNGKGGFAPTKYNSTKAKMKPVIDKLLQNL